MTEFVRGSIGSIRVKQSCTRDVVFDLTVLALVMDGIFSNPKLA